MAVCSCYDILRQEICCAITTLQRSIPLNGESPWLSRNKAKGLGLALLFASSLSKDFLPMSSTVLQSTDPKFLDCVVAEK
mmetsp:Transcript_120701/g.336122  ORF Transcript_120701/g.336122 Transcript_120701/m.336122 type:complete len:80 (+) Transcript_120701:132-371(+)